MILRFEYNHSMEFVYQTWSSVEIKGNGKWLLETPEFKKEFINSNQDFNSFLEDYIENTLIYDFDNFKFNEDDLNALKEYCCNDED